MNLTRALPAIALALTCVACGADEPPTKKVMPDGTITMAMNESDKALAELAKRTLADSLDIPMTKITVDSIRAVEWRDGSIGCPEPDMAYAQVITPGHKILLMVDGRTYAVHEANGRAKVCQVRKASTQVNRQLQIAWGPKSIEARSDLASRLGVEENLVIVSGATQTEWKDRALGCPKAGVSYTPERVPGYILRLRYGGREFIYHTDLEQVIPCPDISAD